jgi:predicted metal-binding protein
MAHDLTRFLELAKNLGADEAKIIDPVTIKTAAWVRLKCMYGCSSRRGRCCPPHTPPLASIYRHRY